MQHPEVRENRNRKEKKRGGQGRERERTGRGLVKPPLSLVFVAVWRVQSEVYLHYSQGSTLLGTVTIPAITTANTNFTECLLPVRHYSRTLDEMLKTF